ncbi:D-alanyl-D-alanine carboxypeptidase family protein [Arthrobacter sp. EH-1B-1]|uniref:D-alanyl-D-alanine carboxypeptidase family protein n=1 Tax=Arthrobacter vasquezii TaxID=2977629 RepID=A0ABT6CY01_9MICC|nr:D-alanyl-D-alanine carboxypeptidase family protein [Arthrobacter vasquezii]MDF9278965.1 D-alanyl-D-alanine carboxypeptidase family protein [Arthrobacter vasquezii]
MSELPTAGRPRLRARFAAVVVVCFTLLTGLLTAPPAVAALPVNDPGNIQVLVTKSRPLNPLRYIAPDLVFFPGTNYVLRREVSANLQNLFAGARSAGAPLAVVSAYRSYDQQAALYNSYVAQYGQAVADTISARPGHSEHQTGLAVDVGNLSGSCGLNACFATTAGGRWVAANAHRYGFIIRYPDGYQSTTGYTFEPWHLRYVGRSVATEMRTRGIPTMEHYYNGSNPPIKHSSDVVAVDSTGTSWTYPSNFLNGFRPRARLGAGWSTLKAGFSTDWNADGLQDILAQWNDGRLTLYRGQFGGGFRAPISIGHGWGSYDITVGAWLRGSRFPSVVAKDGAGVLWHYANTAGAGLSAPARIGHGWQNLRLTQADWDRDGNQDILAIRTNGQLALYRSTGAGAFVNEARRVIGHGWQGMDSVKAIAGFQGPGSYGLRARSAAGELRYYPMPGNRWGAAATIGHGWQTYRLFR